MNELFLFKVQNWPISKVLNFTFFECKIIFLNFPLQWITLLFEAVILPHEEKERIFERLPNQFLIFIIKASFVPNSKPSPHLAQFLHVVSMVLLLFIKFLFLVDVLHLPNSKIISNHSDQEKEENHLTAVFQANGYPKKFISNTIRASQLPRQSANSDNTENQEQIAPVRINLPYVKGTSEQLERIFNDHNINCTLYTTTTLRTLLLHVKDPVPSEQRNNIVYKYDCKDCEVVNFGEPKRAIAERTKEHTRAVRAADTRKYETADHCWKYNHDFDWENKKIIDYETNTTTRKIKGTIHSLSNNNHINADFHTPGFLH